MPFYIGVPQIDNGKLRINWDASYDFKARDIRYTVELARDYAIKDDFFKAEDVLLPEVTCDAPDAGQILYACAPPTQTAIRRMRLTTM